MLKYFIENFKEANRLMVATVTKDESTFFDQKVIPNLYPITEQDYVEGFWAMLQTMAKYIYLLDESGMYWMVMWEGGLLTLSILPQGEMKAAYTKAWVGEDWIQPAYRLFYSGWDAQFDEKKRTQHAFRNATHNEQNQYQTYLGILNQYSGSIQAKTQSDPNFVEASLENIRRWTKSHPAQ